MDIKFSKIKFFSQLIYTYSMKSYSRVEKRRRASTRGIDSRLENFQDIIQKQLNDDFKVNEYLNQNPPDGKNTEEYIALFNKLLVKKMNKNRKKKLLESSKAQFKSKTNNSNAETSQQIGGCNIVDFYYTQEEYQAIKQESEIQQEIIETKTEEELEMKKILWKEITEKKKSLNLLKGDIGHMIARNQSITVLQSKVNKVSLVSENQLKRVSMALSKDWEEVEQRQDMQKKFHRKLKVIQSVERRNLKKIKSSFIDAMKRKKQIHEKLSQIEQQCASVDEYTDKEKQYQQKNIATKQVFELLGNLCDLIKKSNQYWEGFKNKQYDLKEYSQKIKAQFESLFLIEREKQKTHRPRLKSSVPIITKKNKKPQWMVEGVDQIDQETLEKFTKCILQQFTMISNQIFQKKKVYNALMESLEELWQKINNLERKQISLYENFNEQQRIQLSDPTFSYCEYFTKVKNLEENVRAITLMLCFLKKKVHSFDNQGFSFTSRLYQNCLFHQRLFTKIESIDDQQQLKHSEIKNRKSGTITIIEEIPNFSPNIYLHIDQNLKNWFYQLKNKKTMTPAEKIRVYRPKAQKSQEESIVETAKVLMADSDDEQEETEDNKNGQKMVELTPTRANYSNQYGLSNSFGHSLQKSETLKSPFQESQAKRVILLENIDQTYYKMIKQTLEMEKENTKKNYEFQKNFKRTKYSSQDELLQEKRFEATFSGLFKQTQEEKVYGKTEGTDSKVWKPSTFCKTAPLKKKLVNSLYVDKSKTPKQKLIMSKGKVQKVKVGHNSSMVLPKTTHKKMISHAQLHGSSLQARPQTSSFINRSEKKKLSQKLRLFLHEL